MTETEKRFKNQIPELHLFNIDIGSGKSEKLTQANFIWAALIFEYVEIETCFEFIHNNLKENGHLIVTVQENNGVSSVSQTGIETIKSAGQIFKLVSENELLSHADKLRLCKIDFEENILPNKKSLKTYTFLKKYY